MQVSVRLPVYAKFDWHGRRTLYLCLVPSLIVIVCHVRDWDLGWWLLYGGDFSILPGTRWYNWQLYRTWFPAATSRCRISSPPLILAAVSSSTHLSWCGLPTVTVIECFEPVLCFDRKEQKLYRVIGGYVGFLLLFVRHILYLSSSFLILFTALCKVACPSAVTTFYLEGLAFFGSDSEGVAGMCGSTVEAVFTVGAVVTSSRAP